MPILSVKLSPPLLTDVSRRRKMETMTPADCREKKERSFAMKRLFTVLFAALLLTAALAGTASASDYDAAAEDLAAIGVFRGTSDGFELDRAPTRSEAAIMLVRLLGAEEEAQAAYTAGDITLPFTDVGTTAAPYVAWLHDQGIVNGTSAATYGTGACSAQNYAAFLLRALGYQDGTDFAYADALAFAQEKGFYNALMFPGDFLRDDLAAVTYQALGTDLKDGSTYLLKSLIDSGAVDAQAAAPMTEKIEAYRALQQASAGMDGSTAMDVDVAASIDMSVAQDGETVSMPMSMDGSMQMILDENDLQMAYDFDIGAMGETMTMREWLKDGWVYVESAVENGEAVRTKTQVNLEEQLALLEQVQASASVDVVNVSGLAMVNSITSKTQGSDTVYTMGITGSSMNGMMETAFSTLMGGGTFPAEDLQTMMDMLSFGDITAVYTVDRSGDLKSIQMTFSVEMNVPAEEGGTPMAMTADYDMSMTVNATGDSVRITFPDFSNFEEVTVPETAA